MSEAARSLGEMLARKELPRTPTPTVPAIDRIQQILASANTPGSFATRHTAGWAGISLDVVGVGAAGTRATTKTKMASMRRPAATTHSSSCSTPTSS
jgi:hypothetical protein